MNQHNKQEVSKTLDFISTLELPRAPRAKRSAAKAPATLFDERKTQSLVVGGNVVSFLDTVPAAQRQVIANSTLLAQLGANRQVPDREKLEDWYNAYFSILTQVGWIVQERGFSEHHEAGSDFETNKAILAVASAIFGPASTALVLVTSTLKAMKSMSSGPWMTVFKQESQSAKAGRFQFTAVEPGGSGQPLLSLMAFELEARTNLVQVLFFKFRKSDIVLKHSSGKVTLNDVLLSSAGELIQQRVAPFTAAFIQNLPL
jgi:hypothetical protein